MQELKTAIRASGEHKQRVVIHVAVDGLKIRDEKSGVSLSGFYFTYICSLIIEIQELVI